MAEVEVSLPAALVAEATPARSATAVARRGISRVRALKLGAYTLSSLLPPLPPLPYPVAFLPPSCPHHLPPPVLTDSSPSGSSGGYSSGYGNSGAFGGGAFSGGGGGGGKTCYTCGGVGHLSRDCVQGSKCYNCGGVVSPSIPSDGKYTE